MNNENEIISSEPVVSKSSNAVAPDPQPTLDVTDPSAPTMPPPAAKSKEKEVIQDIDDAKLIMNKNIDAMQQRGENLEDLSSTSKALSEKTAAFKHDTENGNDAMPHVAKGKESRKLAKETKKKKVMLPSEALLSLLKSVPKLPTMKSYAKQLKAKQAVHSENASGPVIPEGEYYAFPPSISEHLQDQLDELPKPPPADAFNKSLSDFGVAADVLSPVPLLGSSSVAPLKISPTPSRPTSASPSLNTNVPQLPFSQSFLPLTLNFFATKWENVPPISSKSYFSGHTLVSPSTSSSTQGVGIAVQTSSMTSSSNLTTPFLPTTSLSSASSSVVTSPTKSFVFSSQSSLPRISSPLSRMAVSSSSFREICSSPLGNILFRCIA